MKAVMGAGYRIPRSRALGSSRWAPRTPREAGAFFIVLHKRGDAVCESLICFRECVVGCLSAISEEGLRHLKKKTNLPRRSAFGFGGDSVVPWHRFHQQHKRFP
jgi:hypothetical protein